MLSCCLKTAGAETRKVLLTIFGIVALLVALPDVQCAPASFQQAIADYRSGHHARALSELEAYKAAYPSNALVRYYIGLCHQQLGHVSVARTEFEWVTRCGDARLQGLAAAALNQLSPGSSTADNAATRMGIGSPQAAQLSVDELETYCLSLINESRRQDGLPSLQPDASLARLARQYAEYMAQHSEQYELSVPRSPHIDLDGRNQLQRANAAGLMAIWRGECIGRTSRGGPSDKDMILDVHRKMMNEPPGYGHRENILAHDANVVGIGVARLPQRLYLTEEFGQR
jgi:uncharacterized protein YkwD